MPIRPEEKARYPKDWKAISRRIRERDGNACKWCKAPNGKLIMRGLRSDADTYMLEDGEVRDANTGETLGRACGSEYDGQFVRIVLTCAHLDHTPENNADDNLAALCQRCHLRYDRDHHQANAAKTRRAKKAIGDLF